MSQAITDLEERTDRILSAFADIETPLLEILHAVQAEFGYVPEEAQRRIADHLNLSRAEVHGVVSFYHDFRAEPAGRRTVKVCRAEACQANGGEVLAARLSDELGVAFGATAADGGVSLEAVYCLGLCACAPAALVDGKPVGRLDAQGVAKLVAEVRR